jgi:hypothetical protein
MAKIVQIEESEDYYDRSNRLVPKIREIIAYLNCQEERFEQELEKAREEGKREGIKGYSSLLKTSVDIIEGELNEVKEQQ